MTVIPLQISEAQFQRAVIDLAMVRGWHLSHSRPAQVRPGRWATPITGHPGVPDLLLARNGRVIAAELKRHNGKPTPGQVRWLEALGGHGRLWTPASWQEITETLA